MVSSHKHSYGLGNSTFKLIDDSNTYGCDLIDSDINGNPRYVLHYEFIAPTFDKALSIAKLVGGRKYRGKWFSGGIVFTTYNIHDILKNVVVNYGGKV